MVTILMGISLGITANASSVEQEVIPTVLPDTNDYMVPEMSLSEAINAGVSEAILTDIDVPEIAEKLNELGEKPGINNRVKRAASSGEWKYMYTAEPYAFYQHTKTKKWKLVQVTPTAGHVANTMIGGYVGAPWSISHNKPKY
ncbi:hypothetical protein DOK76_12880 [Vagococcus sp. DIV0080]|uniref:Uncharacterized protein n=1 Tax=Candidatus Vagococcus giribetii TaxID=2230876 RepID=A0ABS3HW29_9ENTE|nr:hypothetical protein [Vagococcus sp. DIV0080]MBO0477961.1 hypothetical protein [Vagococcus sp. DIV0080]